MAYTKVSLIAVAFAAMLAPPLMAQSTTWTTTQMGGQTNYTGYGPNGGSWTGTSVPMGNQTNTTFYGPNGRMTTCSSVPMGNQVNTTCY